VSPWRASNWHFDGRERASCKLSFATREISSWSRFTQKNRIAAWRTERYMRRMSFYNATVPQFKKALRGLEANIQKAIDYAQSKSFDPDVLSSSRLAPDQFSFARQVQTACDNAKLGVFRLTEKTPPKDADGPMSMAELKARIRGAVQYLDGISEADFDDAKSREVILPYFDGKALSAADYLNEYLLPNFYFHVTTAYQILRHNGVPLSKGDYIAGLSLRDPTR
jgi:hypothetical protein